jgi:hypothetical protein
MPEKLKMHTPDHTAQNIQKLAELFPDCVTEIRDAEGKASTSTSFGRSSPAFWSKARASVTVLIGRGSGRLFWKQMKRSPKHYGPRGRRA